MPAPAPPAPALLAQITAELAAGEDLRTLLERFLAPLVQIAQARAGAVRMLSADGERFELVGTLGLPASLQDTEQLADRHCGFCGEGVDQARVVWTRELRPCALRTGDAFFAGPGRSALAVPLRHGQRVLGIYNLFLDDDREPAPGVLLLLRSVGELLGLALEKHRLEAENLRATVAQERQRMAAELHDAVAQNLTFVKMRLPLLHDAIQACNQESALALLEDVRDTLVEAHGSLREIVTHFRTGVDPRGLAAALETLAARFTVRTGIPLEVDNRLPALQLAQDAQAEVFHIVQEALANVERHAGARHGWLAIEPGLGRVEIRIEDDGVGTPARGGAPASASAHYGLDIMRERAQRLGGLLAVTPRPGGGTMVRCSLPLPCGGSA
ncbi:GAF domain-containing sensor histidine kinase [Ramlibacter sp. AN1133]|uniref:GAF domain-containing sensor histidine kinase n=1 Tax=Ramlibacter sp. AN1133 TaxID=3133429 RepID=UPI0030C4469D